MGAGTGAGLQDLGRSSDINLAVFAGEVRMPSGKTARPLIRDNKDGTITVKFAPTERGLHEMDIKYDGNHIPGLDLLLLVEQLP